MSHWFYSCSPLWVDIPRKTKEPKRYRLNLNQYRNWKPIVNNIIKQEYCKVMEPVINLLPKFSSIECMVYVLHPDTKATRDKMNVLTVVDKFFCDGLTHFGKFSDDNDSIIGSFHGYRGDISRDLPRVDIYIKGNLKNED